MKFYEKITQEKALELTLNEERTSIVVIGYSVMGAYQIKKINWICL